jgi:hypothetical protein
MGSNSHCDENTKNVRCCLTKEKAVEIYATKLSFLKGSKLSLSPQLALKGRSESASTKFGVSAKTIRDIWNRRTWQHATWPLWADESNHAEKSEGRSLCSTNELVNALSLSSSLKYIYCI